MRDKTRNQKRNLINTNAFTYLTALAGSCFFLEMYSLPYNFDRSGPNIFDQAV